MISVVCVYNDENALKNVLLKSLENQTAKFELVTINNLDHAYRSAAEALNYGGRQAQGDYLMFVHQDLWLSSDSWLDDAEKTLKTIPCLGIAGVAGVSEKGKNWYERRKFSFDLFDELLSGRIKPIEKPEEVQTLDECLLIVPRSVFNKLKFDEKTFDGWDSYGADYCLCAARLGLKAYAIPAPCVHSCARKRGYRLWEFKDLLKYQKRLYAKHRKNRRMIYTWMERVSWRSIKFHEFIEFFGPLFSRFFPDFDAILARELSGYDKVLDLGCGYHSPIQNFNVSFSVGVDLSLSRLAESKRKNIHDEYILGDITKLEFAPKSFDAVIAIDVLEYLTKEEGIRLLDQMGHWAREKVLIIVSNGNLLQHAIEGNSPHKYKSSWRAKELRELRFGVKGVGGWKELRGYNGDIKYQPLFLWAWISDMTQKITTHFPNLAFQLMAVKRIGEGNSGCE